MKPRSRLAPTLLALSALLYQTTGGTTNLAEKPLKAAALAKPNVIFALDDSGSMDFEVMLRTSDGAFWWDKTNQSGWDVAGKLHFNGPGTADAQWKKYAYLFPNGTGTGKRSYGDGGSDHFAAPPTWQFAFLRSPAWNPIYYDTNTTYTPWVSAYVSGAMTSYTNAPVTVAKSHPALGTGTMDLTAVQAATTTSNKVFMAGPGIWVPAGSQTCDNGTCTWTTEGVDRVLPDSTNMVRLSMPYFPATFYWPEDCGLVDKVTCVAAPDGTKLKRYEIKPGNTFPSGRNYNDEIQNFANWFQYSRKRRLLLASSMGEVMESLSDLNMGVLRFNNNVAVTMYDIDSVPDASNRHRIAGSFYDMPASGGTPTRATLKYAGEQYRTNPAIIKFACQRNNAFVLTDGFAYATTTTPPAYSRVPWGTGAPYETIYDNSLADLALAYYTINLNTGFALKRVPKSTNDENDNLHMNTYGMTLGAQGTIYAGDGSVPPLGGAWPNPNQDRSPTSVDDLWHATINGRGKMYTAKNRQQTADAILAGMLDIANQPGAQSSVAVSTVNVSAADGKAYLAHYNPAGWAGDLTSHAVDSATAEIVDTASWSASTLLGARDWTSRVMFTTIDGTTGVAFTTANVGSLVNPNSTLYTNAGVVAYLRGARTDEGTVYRQRSSLLGAVINAEPAVDNEAGVVYLASGEGMLHAFSTSDGKEQWAFVPKGGLAEIGETIKRGYSFKTKLDGTPVLGKFGASKILVGGMGAAGRSYFALNVTNPTSHTDVSAAAQVKWTFPGAAHAAQAPYVGYTVGRPVIVKNATHGDVVLLTSGYDNGLTVGDGKGRVWMLNADTGALIHEFVTTEGTTTNEAGLAQLKGFREDDGMVRYVYGGDLLGNVWRFDLTSKTTGLLATLKDSTGTQRQPIMTAPQLARIKGRNVVMVATGRLLDLGDFGAATVQSIYAISEGVTLPNARLATTALTRDGGTITGSVDWSVSRGWHVDLPAGQQVNVDPKFVLGLLFVNANAAGGVDCDQASTGYVIRVATGQGVYETLSSEALATAPVPIQYGPNGEKLNRKTRLSDGKLLEDDVEFATPPAPKKNSWRHIAR